jgi:tetratricopeptide (TPR) repeat protein
MLRAWAIVVLTALLWAASIGVKNDALEQRSSWSKEEDLGVPPESARWLATGYREAAADLVWVRTLVYYGSGVMGENDFRYLTRFIDVVLMLNPTFKRAYSWAAAAVTFKAGTATQEEYRLSVKYLERGMEQFPDDYDFFWRAGLRYWADLYSDDKEQVTRWRQRGADLIEEAIHKPNAPEDLATLAASLRTKLGQNQQAIEILQQKIMTVSDLKARAKLLQRLEGLTSEGLREEMAIAVETFQRLRRKNLQQVPPDLFVLVGPEPSSVIEFDELATERSLFGADSDEGEVPLFN